MIKEADFAGKSGLASLQVSSQSIVGKCDISVDRQTDIFPESNSREVEMED